MVAGLVAARRAVQISSDQPAVFLLPRPAGYQVHADSNGCAAGNTLEEAIVQGFLELVERDAYAIWWYNRLQRAEVDLDQFDDSYIRDLQSPARRNRTPALGARRHQRSRHSDLRGDRALDGERAGKHRVRFRRAFRCAHRLAARADRAESVSVHRPHGRRQRRASPSLDGTTPLRLEDHPYSDAKRQSVGPTALRLEVRPSRHARAGDRLRRASPSAPASISSCSIRRAPTSRSRSSG